MTGTYPSAGETVVLAHSIGWRDGRRRKWRREFVERNVGETRSLSAGGRTFGIGVVEAVLFVPRRPRASWLPVGRGIVGGGADARYGLRWPREVEVVVRVLSAPADARRALGA